MIRLLIVFLLLSSVMSCGGSEASKQDADSFNEDLDGLVMSTKVVDNKFIAE